MGGSTAFHAGRARWAGLVFALFVSICVLAVRAGELDTRGPLRIATGSPGGTYHKIGSDLATLLPFGNADTGIKTIQTTGSHENLKLLSAGEADLALTTEDAYRAFQREVEPRAEIGTDADDHAGADAGADAGTGADTDDHAPEDAPAQTLDPVLEKICVLGVLYVGAAQFVLRKDLVRTGTLDDLEGARLYPGAAGSGTERSTLAIMEALGIDPRLVPVEQRTLTYSESARALREGKGKLDAVVLSGGPPVAALAELFQEAPGEFVILAWTPEHIRTATEAIRGLVASEIAAGTYRGQDAAIPSVGKRTLLVARHGLGSAEHARIKKGMDDLLKYAEATTDPNRNAIHPALIDLAPRYWFGPPVDGMCPD